MPNTSPVPSSPLYLQLSPVVSSTELSQRFSIAILASKILGTSSKDEWPIGFVTNKQTLKDTLIDYLKNNPDIPDIVIAINTHGDTEGNLSGMKAEEVFQTLKDVITADSEGRKYFVVFSQCYGVASAQKSKNYFNTIQGNKAVVVVGLSNGETKRNLLNTEIDKKLDEVAGHVELFQWCRNGVCEKFFVFGTFTPTSQQNPPKMRAATSLSAQLRLVSMVLDDQEMNQILKAI